jgi:hypothetical protein
LATKHDDLPGRRLEAARAAGGALGAIQAALLTTVNRIDVLAMCAADPRSWRQLLTLLPFKALVGRFLTSFWPIAYGKMPIASVNLLTVDEYGNSLISPNPHGHPAQRRGPRELRWNGGRKT